MSSTTDDADDELRQYAFHMEPQVVANGDTWTASYPGADWSVTGSSDHAALKRLGEEFVRRQNAGEDPLSYAQSKRQSVDADLARLTRCPTTDAIARTTSYAPSRAGGQRRFHRRSAG